MVVIGGFNSSNTISLAALCAERVPTYHIETSSAIDPERGRIHYRLAQVHHAEADATDWLPAGRVRVGVTAGASTPNNKIGDVVVRILATRGLRAGSRELQILRAACPREASDEGLGIQCLPFTRYIALGDSLSMDLYPALDAGEIDVAVALERDPSAGRVAPLGAASLLYQNVGRRTGPTTPETICRRTIRG